MAIIIGTNAGNAINGTSAGDIIIAGNGNDSVNGGAGNDLITGGNGNDVLDGGADNDLISGGNGNDTINGGSGADILSGDNGNDTLDGGSGSDILLGGNGDDILIYRASENGNSDDIYSGDSGKDTLRLIVSQAMANSVLFQQDIAALQAQLARGSATYSFKSFDLVVSSIEKLQVVVEGGNTNHAPVAVADTVGATEDVTLTIPVGTLLANDTDSDAGDTRTLFSVQNAVHGTVTINGGNIVFVADANYSGVASFSYTIKDSAGATSTATVTVNVAAAADAPTLAVAAASGNEDSAIALSIASAVTDTDGSEQLVSLVVSAIPVGATLSDGNGHSFTATAGATSFNILGWSLSGLTIKPPADSDVDFALTVTATSREGASGPTASRSATLNVAVNAVADAPTLTAAAASGNEDSAIALSIASAVTDTDGSEQLVSLVVSAIPVGATLSDGNGHSFTATAGATSFNILGWSLSDLTIKPPADSDVDFALTVTATSREGASGPTASRSATLNVAVNAVADAPTLTVAAASGNEDSAIALSIASAVTDTDGSEQLVSLEVSAIPVGATLSDGNGHSFTATAGATSFNILGWSLSGLTIKPPADSDVDFALTVTATSREGASGPTASRSATLNVAVNAVADAPTLTAAAASGNEDSAIALSIASAVTDTDGSEQLVSLVVSAIPVGATLSDGNGHSFTATAGATSFNILGWSLSGLTIKPPADSDVDFALTVTATSREGASGPTASRSATLNVAVNAVADAPTLTVAPASGNEDSAIALSIASAVTDTDGSETLSVLISGVPAGAQLSAGQDNHDGTWSLTGAQLAGLTITPPSNFSGQINLTVAASSTDGADTATRTATFTVDVAGVADIPVVTAAAPSIQAEVPEGNTAFSIPLNIAIASADTSELVSVTISNVPEEFYILSAGDPVGDGVWVVSAADVAGLALLPVNGEGTVGNFTLNFVAQSLDGASTASSAPLNISVGITSNVTPIQLIDGYIVGATVFSDTNGNGLLDAGEAFAITGENGLFTLIGVDDPTATLVSFGGIDASTGQAFQGQLRAPGGSTVVTPLTTLVTALIEAAAENDVELSVDAANATVASALGISEVDFTNYDPVAETSSGTPGAAAILSAAIQVQATITQIAAAVGGEGAAANVASAIALAMNDTTTTFDLTASDTLTDIITEVAPAGGDAIAQVAQVVAVANAAIETASSGGASGLAQAASVALGQITEQLASAGLDSAALTLVVNNNTAAAVQAAVQNAEIPDTLWVGTIGNDVHTAGAGADVLEGLDGNDVLDGAGGNDTISGGAGADLLTGGAGDDLLEGGLGQDSAIYTAATISGINVDLASGVVTGDSSVGVDTLRSVEQVRGTGFADTYVATGFWTGVGVQSANIGSASATGAINNSFQGMGGDDVITGNGRTTASYWLASAAVTVQLSSFSTDGNATPISGTASSTAGGDAAGIGTDTLNNVFWVRGSEYGDSLNGGNGNDVFTGGAGSDAITGGSGFDLAIYVTDTTTGGVSVNMTTGIVTGDASSGTDTLRSIESVRGTNFADTYVATNFGTAGSNNPASFNVGNNGTFNEFEGMAGNDVITGNNNTRILFTNSTGSVKVDLGLAANNVIGNASVGTDTVTGIAQVRGSVFDDELYGSNTTAFTEVFEGFTGNDFIDGRGGFDQAAYNSNFLTTSGVTINMVAGTVVGDATIGSDTLRGIEQVTGTNFADTYNATDFGAAAYNNGTLYNVGSSGTFNSFQGAGGNDTIIGNGNTQIAFFSATGAVTVDLAGTASGNASVGSDTFTGVNNVVGSNFGDTFTGTGNNEVFNGGSGNDSITGGAGGDMAIFSGSAGQYNIAGGTITDTIANRDGMDTLSGVELLQFNNAGNSQYRLIASGDQANPVNIVGLGLGGSSGLISLTNADDFLTIGSNFFGRPIDLGTGGNDTVNLGLADAGYILALAGVENLNGGGGNENVTLSNLANGMSVNLGAGNMDSLFLANGSNTLTLNDVESVSASGSNNTLTLNNSVTTLSVSLGLGVNTLNLLGTTNSLVNLFGVQAINGSASDDSLTFEAGTNNITVNLGAGTNDTVTVNGFQANALTTSGVETLNLNSGAYDLTAIGVQAINGGSNDDQVFMASNLTGAAVDLGGGNNDTIWLADGTNTLSASNIESINGRDFGATISNDVLFLQNTQSGASVNLGQGINTLNLAQGDNTLSTLYGVATVNGSDGGADNLTIVNGANSLTVDLGEGTDSLALGAASFGVTVIDVENVTGSAGGDIIVIGSTTGSTTVTGGEGADFITAGASADSFRYTAASQSTINGVRDHISGFSATEDRLIFSGVSGLVGPIEFVGTNAFTGGSAQARLVGSIVQIDVDGDGSMTAADMEIEFVGLADPLTNANFVVEGGVVNQAPTGISFTNVVASLGEGTSTVVPIKVADVVVADDGIGTNMLSLTGADAASFDLVGTALYLKAGVVLDFEAKPSLDVTVQVDDGSVGGSPDAIAALSLVITDTNEAPSAVGLVNAVTSLGEGTSTASRVKVADIAVTDDALGTNALSLTGADAALFEIVGTELFLKAGASLNYEGQPVLDVVVQVDDAAVGGTPDAVAALAIAITDENEAPTAVNLTNAVSSLGENASTTARIKVADIAVADDALGANVLGLSGADAALFEILGSELFLKAGVSLNHETQSVLNVTVQVDDGSVGGTPDAVAAFALSITDVNEAPTDIALSNASVDENSAAGTVVGSLTRSDVDSGDTATYTLANNPGGLFAISGSNLTVVGNLDYETATSHVVRVRVTDAAANTYEENFTITVNNLGEGEILGTEGDDNSLNGTPGNDTIRGLGGNDVLNGSAGTDLLDGGAGQDIANYSATGSGITVNLASGAVTGGDTDTLRSIETVRGTGFVDTFTAAGFWTGSGALSANLGSPSFAGPVNNAFEGMGGNDSITGNGRTTASYLNAAAGVTVNLSTGAANGSATSTAGGDAAAIGTDTLINVNWVRGSEFVDVLNGGGGAQNDVFTGGGGADAITGGGGFDLSIYVPAAAGISVNMGSGIVSGGDSDLLRSIESVRGSNFADTLTAGNIGAGGANVGSNGTFVEFEGMGGNDTIVGNNNTRILFTNASGAVSVDLALASNQVVGDSSVGTDTVSGIAQVRGSSFNDTIRGSNTTAITEVFEGWTGDDLIDGRGGFDQVVYNNNGLLTSGVSIAMATGQVVGDAFVGTDTLRGIEQVYGSNLADTYSALNFGAAGYTDANFYNVGINGTFNSFQGLGGNDTITGNGNTQIVFYNAGGGVTVNLAAGTVTGDTSVGSDNIVGGVNNVVGSNFADNITGGGGNETLSGGSPGSGSGNGNDTINGGGGTDMVTFHGVRGNYTMTVNATTTVQDGTSNRDGLDSLTDVEVLQFSNGLNASYALIAAGTSAVPVDLSGFNIQGPAGLTSETGVTDDFVTIGQNFIGRPVNLAAGTGDTVNLGLAGGNYNGISLVGVEYLNGAAGSENVTLNNLASGLSVDLKAGSNDVLFLANGANALSVSGVEQINGIGSNNILTLNNSVSGVAVNLGGGVNTLNLLATTNSLANVFGVQTINGTNSDDSLTLESGANQITVHLGVGANDTLTVNGFQANALTTVGVETLNLGNGAYDLMANGVQVINGSNNNDSVYMLSTLTGTTVDLGAGINDLVALANGANTLTALNIENINGSDFGGAVSDDVLFLQNTQNGASIHLGNGSNTVNLAEGSNTLATLFGVTTMNGTDGNDDLTIVNGVSSMTVDLGDGTDSLTLGGASFGITVVDVETLTGSSGNDTLVIGNTSGTTMVTGGLGADFITGSAAADNFHFASVADSAWGGVTDVINNFDASSDSFTFTGLNGANGFASEITFVGTDNFAGGSQSQARLTNNGGTLQIDVDGNGVMNASDMEIQLGTSVAGLTNANFHLV